MRQSTRETRAAPCSIPRVRWSASMTRSRARSPVMSASASPSRSTPSTSCSIRSKAATTSSHRLRLEHVDGGQVPIELVVVEPVADDERIWDVEPLVTDGNGRDAALFLVQEDAELERRRPVALDVLEEERCGQPGVDDVLDHQHVATGDVHGEVLEQLDVSG